MSDNKIFELQKIVNDAGSVVLAYSGGVDSSLLLKVAASSGIKLVAVTFHSILYPKVELEISISLAKLLNVEHIIIEHNPLSIPELRNNPKERCYICKLDLYSKLLNIKAERGFDNIFDGNNFDDLSMYRPGIRAVKELGIISPLALAKLSKADVRQVSKKLGLNTWNKPSFACYFSRFDYGITINEDMIRQVSEFETKIHSFGLISARVRYHKDIARIEFDNDDFNKATLADMRKLLIDSGKLAGFKFIAIDLNGYQTGCFD